MRRMGLPGCLILVLACGTCRTGEDVPVAATTQADRLMSAYAELRAGRFLVLADFENPRHMELVAVEGDGSQPAAARYDGTHGRAPSGAGCVRFGPKSNRDRLTFSNRGPTQWYMNRDWRDFDVLLLAVESVGEGAILGVHVASGRGEARRTATARITLRPGWNEIRIDLADLGRRVALDDVRVVSLGWESSDVPQTYRVDDLILTTDREQILPPASERAGTLYVERVGLHYNVGARERFELSFADGAVSAWYDVRTDPMRLRNLLDGIAAVPAPDPHHLNQRAGETILGAVRGGFETVRPLEANPIRVVMECRPQSSRGEVAGRDRCVYTIYATGQVYVRGERRAPDLGIAGFSLAMLARPSDTWRFETLPLPSAGSRDVRRCMLARSLALDAAVLLATNVSTIQSDIGNENALPPGLPTGGSTIRRASAQPRWDAHVFFSSSTLLTTEEARARASAFFSPPTPAVLHSTQDAPEEDQPAESIAFRRSTGVYEVRAAQSVARILLEPGKGRWFSPVFNVATAFPSDVGNGGAWVYANDKLMDATHPGDGDVLFQIPSAIDRRTTIEVLFQPAPPPGSGG